MADVSAQDGVMVHEATITVETDPRSKYFHGYSNYIGPLYGEDRVESIYGSITDATFEHEGTQYEIQRLFYNWALDTLYLKIDPLLEPSSNILPTLSIGGEIYDGPDTFLSLHDYIWWEDIAEQDWEVGNSIPFTLSLTTVSSSDTDAQSNADGVPANIMASLTESGEEEGGGFSGLMAWLAGAGAVALASIGYVAYRVLR